MIPIAVLAQNEPPVADAGPDQSIYTGDVLWLFGTATSPDGTAILLWSWAVVSAPDGSIWQLSDSDRATAIFQARSVGDYVLALVVVDAYGNFSAPDFVTIHAADNLPPVAVVTADKTSGVTPLTVCFDGSQSHDPEGLPLTYYWNFGDGSSPVTSATLCHTFLAAGTSTVTFRVTDVRGATDSEVLSIVANPPANQPPVASPTATPNTGDAPLTVQFAANASDPDNDPLTYAWSFGDPGSGYNTSNLPDPQHIYMHAGAYVAQLTVSDGKDSASYSLTIAVSAAIELNVTKADIDFKSKKSALADVEIQAELYAPIPAAADVVTLYLDGAKVFSVPFSAFEPVKERGRIVPGTYKLKTNDLWVQIDFIEGRLVVDAKKVLLTGYDPSNGVDVEVRLGDEVAVDNIQPEDDHGDRHYRHHRGERGRGHCGRDH